MISLEEGTAGTNGRSSSSRSEEPGIMVFVYISKDPFSHVSISSLNGDNGEQSDV